MKTTILTTCNNNIEASMVQSLLEIEGIQSILTNESYTSLYPGMNGTLGSGIDILVSDEDFERASQLINTIDRTVHCPKCNSKEVHQIMSKNWLGRIGVMLLGIVTLTPVGTMQSKYQCNNCGKKFVI